MKISIRNQLITAAIAVLLWVGIASSSTPSTYSFQDGFESGNLSNWDWVWTTQRVTINSDPKFVRSGNYSARFQYIAKGTYDDNQHIGKQYLKTGIRQFRFAGYVYFQSDSPAGGKVPISHFRKLIYCKGKNVSLNDWWIIIGSRGLNISGEMRPPRDSLYSESDFFYWNQRYQMQFDRWHKVEFEVKQNSIGQRNGSFKLWIDGQLVVERLNANIGGNDPKGLVEIGVGNQVNVRQDLGDSPTNEYRYWDDIVISGIGGSLDTSPPASPAGLRIVEPATPQ